MDMHRLSKKEDWLSEEMLPYYIQYVNDQMIYKEDFITELTKILEEHQGEQIMEYCSGVSGLLYQGLFPNPSENVICAENDEFLLKIVKEHLKEREQKIETCLIVNDVEMDSIQEGACSVIYAFDFLHSCNNLKNQLDILMGKLKTGGLLWFYDLRRDAEQSMLEQVMIGYKNLKCEQAGWYLNNFISSWRASYTIDEIKEILKEYPFITYEVEKDNALTVSVKIKKEG